MCIRVTGKCPGRFFLVMNYSLITWLLSLRYKSFTLTSRGDEMPVAWVQASTLASKIPYIELNDEQVQ